MISKNIMSTYKINEPLMLAGKHRVQGETTEPLLDDNILKNLCLTGAITKIKSIAPVSIVEELANLEKEGDEIARGNSKLDTYSNKKKRPK